MLVIIYNLPQVSVLKAKINESVGLPGGKQKLQYDVSIPGRTEIPLYMLAFHMPSICCCFLVVYFTLFAHWLMWLYCKITISTYVGLAFKIILD